MNLKQMREKSGLKANFIAEQLSVSRQTYRNYELGKHVPDIYKKDKLARLFKVNFLEIELALNECRGEINVTRVRK